MSFLHDDLGRGRPSHVGIGTDANAELCWNSATIPDLSKRCEVTRMIPYVVYLPIFVGLGVLVILGGLRISPLGLWPPLGLVIALEFALLKSKATPYRLAAYLMPAILVFACIQIVADRGAYQQFQYRVYEMIPFAIVLIVYQVHVWKVYRGTLRD